MLLVDLEVGKIIQDEELKQQVIGKNDYKKIIFSEKIYVGERIRDIVFDKKENLIFLALEETGSVGILKNN